MTAHGAFVGSCLVIGGSGGIGRAVVELLVASGQSVAFTYRGGLDEARGIEAASNGLAHAYALDLSDREAPRRVVDAVESELPPIVGLVNAAGIQRGRLLAMTSDAAWDELLEVNLTGAFRCCRAVLGGMVRRRRGSIVNIASLAALHGVAGLGAYAASKAGLLAMTRSLAREVGKRGIRVNAVIPGFVATEMTRGLPAATVEHLRAGECLGARTEARDVAHAVDFLLSDRASSITGQALAVDAGTSA
jgi:3-oxoacyl-[acyl-carrier protein] reductase